MRNLSEEPTRVVCRKKRRLRQFYVYVNGQHFAVWAHTRERAEQIATESLLSELG